MSLAPTEDVLLAHLHAAGGASALSAAVDTLVSGEGSLSRQVAVSSAIETLAGRDLLTRETGEDGRVRLRLTDRGRDRAATVHDRIAALEVDLVGDTRSTCTVATAADRTGHSVPELVVRCSGDGVFVVGSDEPDGTVVDREEIREQCLELVDQCRSEGRGELVVLRGMSGIGKTTLLDAHAEDVRRTRTGIDVLQAGCGSGTTEPYEPLRELVSTLDDADDPFRSASDGDGGLDRTTTEPAVPQGQQVALFEDLTDRFAPSEASELSVIAIDDLHHADAATLAYVRYLLDRLPDRPILVIVTSAPGGLAPEPTDERMPERAQLSLDAVADGPTPVTTIDLDGLDRPDTRSLIEATVGRRGAPAELVDAVQERTDGVPLHVEATVEALLDDDQLDPEFRWYPEDPESIALPASVRQVVLRSLETLDGTARTILEWAAVAGDPIPVSVLESVCDVSDRAVDASVELLVGANQLSRSEATGVVGISTELARETLLDALDPQTRRRRHRTLADALQADGEHHAGLIARQYDRAGDLDLAFEWYRTAVDRATDMYAHETAIEHCHRMLAVAKERDRTERVLDACEALIEIYGTIGEYDRADRYCQFLRERIDEGDESRRLQLLGHEAEIATQQGDYDVADEAITAALELDTAESERRCRLLGVAASARQRRGEFDAAAEHATEQLALAEDLGATAERIDALLTLGTIDQRRGDHDCAERRLEQCLDIATRVGNLAGKSEALNILSLVDWSRGDFEQARQRYHECLELKREIDDRHGESDALNNLGVIEQMQANYERAREYYERALEINRALGDRDHQAGGLHNLGAIAQLRTEYDLAIDYYEECLEIKREIDDRHGEALALSNLGEVYRRRGDYDAAREYQQASLEIKRELDNRRRVAISLWLRASLRRDEGRIDDARTDAERALEIAEELDADKEIGDACRVLASVERVAGEYDLAREHARRSIDVLESCEAAKEAAESHLVLARSELAAGEMDAATTALETARSTFEDLEVTHFVGHCNLLQGDLAARDRAFGTAREHWQAALDAYEAVGAPHHTANALERLVDACERDGDPDRALYWCSDALDRLSDADATAVDGRIEWFERRMERLEAE